MTCSSLPVIIFFFNDTATTEIYTLSLHDALPIFVQVDGDDVEAHVARAREPAHGVEVRAVVVHDRARRLENARDLLDRKSTRLNSSHANISHAVFCLKKK